jgi:hypothetical protein
MATRPVKRTSFPTVRDARRDTSSAPVGLASGHNPKESREESIRLRAYFLAEAAGFPAGRADDFWLQAEKENLNLTAEPKY